MTKLNDTLGWFVVAVVLLSPIPLGSNPPAFWAISGTIVGLAALIYLVSAARGHQALRFPLGRMKLLAELAAVLCLYLIVQMLPLGKLFGPFSFATGRGQVVESVYLSLAPGSTWMMLIRMVSYGLFFFLALQVSANERRAERLVTVIFWAVVAHAAFGLIQLTQLNDTLLGFDKVAYQGMATGTFVNRNSYATFLAMGLAVGAGLLANAVVQVTRENRTLGEVGTGVFTQLAGMLVLVIAIAASQSRMGLIAAVLGAVVVLVLAARWIKWHPVVTIVAVVVALGGFVALLSLFGQGVLERITMLEETGSGRTDIWSQVIEMIQARPLLGYGGGSFELAFPLFEHAPLWTHVLVDKAHSTYLQLFAELGVVFGALPIIIVGCIVGSIVLRYMRSEAGIAVRLAAIGALVAAATHTAVDFSLEMQANAYLLVALLAMGRAVAGRTASS